MDLPEQIEVSLEKGGKAWVSADSIIGHYAVHQALGHSMGWTVTHISTGMKVWTTYEYRDALKVANILMAEGTIPEERERAVTWRATMEPSAYSKLVERLTIIAPRVIPT